MTCVVGVAVPGHGCVLAADSLGLGDAGAFLIETQGKLFTPSSRLAVGFTRSYREGQIMRYLMEWPPKPQEGTDVTSWIVREVVGKLRETLKEHGALEKGERGADQGAWLILAVRDRVFEIAPDFQVTESAAGYVSLGSGYRYALGAMAVQLGGRTAATLSEAESFARSAIGATEAHNTFVRSPITCVRTMA